MPQHPDVTKLATFLNTRDDSQRPSSASVLQAIVALAELMQQDSYAQTVHILDGALVGTSGTLLRVDTGAVDIAELGLIDPSAYPGNARIIVTPATREMVVVLKHAVDGPAGRILLTDQTDLTLFDGAAAMLYLDGEDWRQIVVGHSSQSEGRSFSGLIESSLIAEDFSLAENHFWSAAGAPIIRVDTGAATRRVTIAPGIPGGVPGIRRVAVIEKAAAANTLEIRPAAGASSASPQYRTQSGRSYASNSATSGVNNGNVGSEKTAPTGVGNNLCAFFLFFVNYKDPATRQFSIKINGTTVAWDRTEEDSGANSDPSAYLHVRPLGNLATEQTLMVQAVAGATGTVRSWHALMAVASGVDQTTPFEAWSAIQHDGASSVATKTLQVTTNGPNRLIIYGGARRSGEGTATFSNATQTLTNGTGNATGENNLRFAYGYETAVQAGTHDASITWTGSTDSYATMVGFALRPVSDSAGITMLVPGGGSELDITALGRRALVEYAPDGLTVWVREV